MESPSSEKTISSDDEIDYSAKPEFYDPDLDAKDEKWLNKRRSKVGVGGGSTSDAVLSCPACFTTLCLESQRHDQYVTQYRAVFVVNCLVNQNASTQIQTSEHSNNKRKRKTKTEERVKSLKPVCCGVCSSEVGVFDEDEIYHFFNVLPSENPSMMRLVSQRYSQWPPKCFCL